MTDDDYVSIIGQIAADFHEKYMKNPHSDSQNMEIAVEYTTFILSRFAKLVQERDERPED